MDCFTSCMHPEYKISWPPFTKSVIGLVVLFFVFWILSVISIDLRSLIFAHMSVSLENIMAGRFWTIFFYGFSHQSFSEVLFISIALWLFGAELQSIIGLKKWWALQLSSVLLGGFFVLGWSAALQSESIPLHGYHAAIIGLITAYCLTKWNEKVYLFTIPLSGKTMLIACISLSVLMSVIGGMYIRLLLDLAGVLCGFLISGNFFKYRELRTRYRLWRARRKLKLVRGPERKDYGPN